MSKTIGSDQSGLNRLIRVSRDEGMEVEKIANFLSISDPKFQRKTSYPATSTMIKPRCLVCQVLVSVSVVFEPIHAPSPGPYNFGRR